MLEEELVYEIKKVKGSFYALKFSECGRYLAAGGEDKKMYVWNVNLAAYEDGLEDDLENLKNTQKMLTEEVELMTDDSEGEQEQVEKLKESLKKLREEDPIQEKVLKKFKI